MCVFPHTPIAFTCFSGPCSRFLFLSVAWLRGKIRYSCDAGSCGMGVGVATFFFGIADIYLTPHHMDLLFCVFVFVFMFDVISDSKIQIRFFVISINACRIRDCYIFSMHVISKWSMRSRSPTLTHALILIYFTSPSSRYPKIPITKIQLCARVFQVQSKQTVIAPVQERIVKQQTGYLFLIFTSRYVDSEQCWSVGPSKVNESC